MTTTRRGFLKLLGIGAAAAVAPAIILPERRIWAVGFGAPRDVHAALGAGPCGINSVARGHTVNGDACTHCGKHRAYCAHVSCGSLFGVDPGYSAKNIIWARWDDESKMLVVDEIDKAEVLADTRRIGSPRLYAEWRGIRDMPAHAVLWTSITASKT